MVVQAFVYPSKVVSLIVQESGGVNPQNHCIHENILLQVPYFAALLSDRWDNGSTREIALELPPFSSTEGFNAIIQALYRGIPSSLGATTIQQAIGIFGLVKMLQVDVLEEQALENIRQFTMTDGGQVEVLMSSLNEYSTLEEVRSLLSKAEATFDDTALASVIRGCRTPAHSNLLLAALNSRATFGFREKDIMRVLRYMSTPIGDKNLLPILKPAKAEKRGSQEWEEKARAAKKDLGEDFPLCLEETSAFEALWKVICPRISSHEHFVGACAIFQSIVLWHGCVCFKTGRRTTHTISLCELIPRQSTTTEQSPDGENIDVCNNSPGSPLVCALGELLAISVSMLKADTISMQEFLDLVDCSSPNIMDSHAGGVSSCGNKMCHLLRVSGITLSDKQLSELLKCAKDNLLPAQSITLSKHLLNSHRWGLKCLGPHTTTGVQTALCG